MRDWARFVVVVVLTVFVSFVSLDRRLAKSSKSTILASRSISRRTSASRMKSRSFRPSACAIRSRVSPRYVHASCGCFVCHARDRSRAIAIARAFGSTRAPFAQTLADDGDFVRARST